MVKLLSFSAIGALSLAVGAVGAMHHDSSPPSLHRLHLDSVRRALRDAPRARRLHAENEAAEDEPRKDDRAERLRLRRVAGEDDDSCPGAPFLWKINDAASGEHVGFGVGTMHLPLDVVTTPSSYASILAAIEDSCDVYGELNVADGNVTAALEACGLPLEAASATVADIPDGELRAAIEAKILDVSMLIDGKGDAGAADPAYAEQYAARLLTLPLPEVQRIILYGNTPEYVERYLDTILSDDGAETLDANILKFGRPAKNLEEVSTHCDILRATHPTAEELNQSFDRYSAGIRESIDASLTREIDMYECGDVDAFVREVAAGMAVDGDANDDLLSDRNARMAARMIDVLNANPDEKALFAVGVAHWIAGTRSLEALLNEGGYRLEHVPEWDSEHAVNHSNERCEVMFTPDGEVFVPAPAPRPGVTKEPTHSVVDETYFTAEGNETFVLTKEDDKSSSAVIGASKATVLAGGFVYLLCCI